MATDDGPAPSLDPGDDTIGHTNRTFVAVEVPGGLGQKLIRLQSLLAPDLSGVRWVAPDQFHITLAFLGDVDNTDLNHVCKAVATAAAPCSPLALRLASLGCFPDPQRARTLWVGLTGPGLESLLELQCEIADAARSSGYPPDEKQRFHPHVTLGRLKPGRGPSPDLTAQLNHFRTWAAGSWEARETVVFASTLTPDGPVYTPLGRAPFRGGKAPSSA